MSLDSVVLLSALVLTGCAGIQVETLDPQLGNDDDAGLIGNPSFDETADAEHRVIVDMLNGPRPSTSFQIAGRERHRVLIEVQQLTQRVHIELDAPRTDDGAYPLHAVSFHGESWMDTPPVETEVARQLNLGNAVDVTLDPGVYAFDLESFRASSDDVYTIRIGARAETGGFQSSPSNASAYTVGETFDGELRFGDRRFVQLTGSDRLGLAAAGAEWSHVCYELWGRTDDTLYSLGSSSSTWRFLTPVHDGERLYVELIGCDVETTPFRHQVIDQAGWDALSN